MELLKRQRRILQILINNQGTYLSSDNIADLLGVSYKTVQTDIEVLRDEIDAYDVEIESVRGKGYRLRFPDMVLWLVTMQRLKSSMYPMVY